MTDKTPVNYREEGNMDCLRFVEAFGMSGAEVYYFTLTHVLALTNEGDWGRNLLRQYREYRIGWAQQLGLVPSDIPVPAEPSGDTVPQRMRDTAVADIIKQEDARVMQTLQTAATPPQLVPLRASLAAGGNLSGTKPSSTTTKPPATTEYDDEHLATLVALHWYLKEALGAAGHLPQWFITQEKMGLLRIVIAATNRRVDVWRDRKAADGWHYVVELYAPGITTAQPVCTTLDPCTETVRGQIVAALLSTAAESKCWVVRYSGAHGCASLFLKSDWPQVTEEREEAMEFEDLAAAGRACEQRPSLGEAWPRHGRACPQESKPRKK